MYQLTDSNLDFIKAAVKAIGKDAEITDMFELDDQQTEIFINHDVSILVEVGETANMFVGIVKTYSPTRDDPGDVESFYDFDKPLKYWSEVAIQVAKVLAEIYATNAVEAFCYEHVENCDMEGYW